MEKLRRLILWKKSGDYFAGNVHCNTYFTFSGRCGASTSDVQLKTHTILQHVQPAASASGCIFIKLYYLDTQLQLMWIGQVYWCCTRVI